MIRHVLRLFALGFLLLGAKTLWQHLYPRPTPLLVTVPEGAPAHEVERRTREAILASEALARGAADVDPIVRDELLHQMRLLYPDVKSDALLLEHALSLGLPLTDPLLRKRLASHLDPLLGLADGDAVTDEALEGYLAEHRARYDSPARTSFLQVFRRRGARAPGETLVDVERALKSSRDSVGGTPCGEGSEHAEEGTPASCARRWSEPSLVPFRFTLASAEEVEARLGQAFGAALARAKERQWSGPISSPYGNHFVFVIERRQAQPAHGAQLRERLVADYLHDTREQRVQASIANIAERYAVEVRGVRP